MLNVTKFARLAFIGAALAAPTLTLAKFAPGTVSQPPANMAVLGPQTYITMELKQLANPSAPYVDADLARQAGYEVDAKGLTPEGLKAVFADYGYAGSIYSEPASAYTDVTKSFYVGGYGGIGLNQNLGDGRSVIAGQFRIKGGARTPKVKMKAKHHSDGSSILAEGIRESLVAKLVDFEMPYGALKTLAVILPNTMIGDKKDLPRALIVSEDPLRYAHYILNQKARELGGQYQIEDELRVKSAFLKITEALPKPAGLDLTGKTQQELFVIGLNETIDRQATQLGYAWAHKMFHAATSPSNMTLDGRMVDFGTFSFLNSYVKLQKLTDDGPSGDPEVFIRDMWAAFWWTMNKNLSPELRAVLPTRQTVYNRFLTKFHQTKRDELVYMAGLFNEIKSDILATTAAKNLGEVLFNLAMAGNEEVYGAWEKPEEALATHEGTYSLEKILNALAGVQTLSKSELSAAIETLLPDVKLRSQLVENYAQVFALQSQRVQSLGVSAEAEKEYRKAAAKIRNTSMSAMFWTPENVELNNKVQEDFIRTKDSSLVQNYIDDIVRKSRRAFRDAAPFTVVLSETKTRSGRIVRQIYDAKAGKYRQVEVKPVTTSMICNEILKAAKRGGQR